MANRTRATPLTDEARKERNRVYQQRRREKTDNAMARAYNRAVRRAGEWVRENQPELWEQWLAEELANPSPTEFKAQCQHEHSAPLGRAVRGIWCYDCKSWVGRETAD